MLEHRSKEKKKKKKFQSQTNYKRIIEDKYKRTKIINHIAKGTNL